MGEAPRRGSARGLARRAIGALVVGVGVLGLGPAALLAVVGETRPGRLFGGAAAGLLVASGCLAVLLLRVPARPRPWAIGASLGLAAAIGLGAGLVRGARGGDPARSDGLLSIGAGAPGPSPFGLVPEIDQVKLGVTLATRWAPWSGRARAIREVTMGLYREIEADPGARGLGPVTGLGVRELAGFGFDSGHCFAYVPRPRAGESLGLVVFLHGNGGNLQAVPWAWRPFAERHRVAVLCPTFGFGFWGEGGAEAVERARLDASRRWLIDPRRVYLAGLSDGGAGVIRSAAAHPDLYRGLIYISPTMRLDELGAPGFAEAWRGRPVLVFQGDRDGNVPKATVDPAVGLLRRRGVAVEYDVFPGEDHFLFFSRRDELSGRVGAWMAGIERTPSAEQAKAGER